MAANKYLQQATGAFRPIQASDLTTTITSTTVFPLQNYSALTNASGISTGTAYTIVPNCTLTQGTSGVWLVSGWATFTNSAIAELWRLQITDGTTADGSAVSLAVGLSNVAVAGQYSLISLTAIATSPSSQLTLQYEPGASTTTSQTVNGGCGITAVRIG